MRILIVDDDEGIRHLLSATLTRSGHEVLEAIDGQTGWDKWQEGKFHFVISDWSMPNLEGPELARRIRATPNDDYTYFILVTSRSTKQDIVAGLEAGADDYLIKPFDPPELRARVAIGERILSLEKRLKDAVAQQRDLATHDSLTGLFNRRALYELAEAELERARREGKPVSLIMLDIDHFKQVNDRHGHLVGDQSLRYVANALNNNRRPYDLAGRWGGEEFLLVLPATALTEAAAVAERLRSFIAEAAFITLDGQEVHLRASFGVSSTSLAGA